MRAAKFSVPSLLRTHTPAAFGPGDGQTLTVRVLVPIPRFLQRGSHPEFRRTAFVFSWCFFGCVNVRGKEIQNVHESLLQLLMFCFFEEHFCAGCPEISGDGLSTFARWTNLDRRSLVNSLRPPFTLGARGIWHS